MDRLSGADLMLLSAEGDTTFLHMSGLAVLDPTGVPGYDFERFRDHVATRSALVPRLRRKLRRVPLDLDRPIWVDDPDFDPHQHIHRLAVPAPGGRRELAEVASALLPHRLDRSRPLWEMWYLEGLEGGRAGLFQKIHHSLFDGTAAAALSSFLFDLEPEADGPIITLDDADVVEPDHSNVELMGRGLLRLATSAPNITRFWVQTARQLGTTGNLVRKGAPSPVRRASKLPWNEPIGAERSLAFGSFPLDDVKRVRKELSITVNDVVLGIAAGGLRRYLLSRDALPDRSLVAAVPASTRTDEPEVGNMVGGMMVSLHTDIADPIERVMGIHREMAATKETTAAVRAHRVTGITDVLLPSVIRRLGGFVGRGRMPVAMNTVVSNIPGPPVPFYLAGAPVTEMYPNAIVGANCGLSVFVMSYSDTVSYGVMADPRLVDDPWAVAEMLDESYAELCSASGIATA